MFPPAIWNVPDATVNGDLNDTPYRRMGMSYQVEELVVPAFAHVAGSGITIDCGIWYVPNGWWKHRWAAS
jgi:hypothetical protein